MWTLIETRHAHLVYSCSCSSLLNSIVVELEILKVVPNLWLVLCVIPPFWFLFGATLSVWRAQKPQVKTLSSARSAIFAQAYQDEWIGMYKPSSWMAFVDTGFPSKWKGNVLYIYTVIDCAFLCFRKNAQGPKVFLFHFLRKGGAGLIQRLCDPKNATLQPSFSRESSPGWSRKLWTKIPPSSGSRLGLG